MIVAPGLRPGDCVYVIAPSGPFDPVLAWRGLGWLAERYRVRFDRRMFDTYGFLAGPDERRARELDDALADPACRAIVAMRGGYGAQRIVHAVDWNSLRRWPKWIVGFSDITALHVEAANCQVASLHAPMAATLGRGCARARAVWVDALENPGGTRRFSLCSGPFALRDSPAFAPLSGSCEGTLFGGNLAILHSCAAAGRLRIAPNCVLVIEDVGERPYRVDRYLTTLIAGGHFDNVVGIVVGQFTDCAQGADRTSVEQVLLRCLEPLGVPVAWNMPFGHDVPNVPVHLGAHAKLNVGPHTTLELSL